MSRPVIGLTTYAEETRFGLKDTFSAVLPLAYVHAVHASGGRAVLITPDDPDIDILDGSTRSCSPAAPTWTPTCTASRPTPPQGQARAGHRRAAAACAPRSPRDLPLLGICRGMQLMGVAYGGRLHQHLPDVLGHNGHRPTSGPKFGEHPVDLDRRHPVPQDPRRRGRS